MAYALHRRAAFRQVGVGSGWNFDLAKSEYLDFGVVLNSYVDDTPGSPLAVGRLFLTADNSGLICQPNTGNGATRLYRYAFPLSHYGDISKLVNASYSSSSRTLFYYRRSCAFSLDGLHYVQQGHDSGNGTTKINGVTFDQYQLFSCPLDSSFSVYQIPTLDTMNNLTELTGAATALAFSSDGLYLLMMPGSGSIRSYYLQTPYDVSSASLVYTQVSLSRFGISGVRDWQFSPDGFTLVLLVSTASTNNATFHVFRMSAPFNITTLSHEQSWETDQNYVQGFTIDRAGRNLYISRSTTILQYALSA